MIEFFRGMTTMGFLVAGLFFLRFWRRTGDALFVSFAAAFWLFAISEPFIRNGGIANEDQPLVFLLRLCGFGMLIVAILIKNLGPERDAR